MIWPEENRLRTGCILSRATKLATTQAVRNMGREDSALAAALAARCTSGRGSSTDQQASSKQARAGRMVIQLRNERLPLRIRVSWKRMITAPAAGRNMRG